MLVAIPNYMREEKDLKMLLRCIASIRKAEPLMSFHVVVVDDASPYFPQEAKDQIHEAGAKIITQAHNGGYSKTVNFAICYANHAGYDVLLTLNSDCEILTPFYARVRQIMNFDPKIDVVGGLCLWPTGKVQSASFTLNCVGGPVQPDRGKPYALGGLDACRSKYVLGVTGAFQFIRLAPHRLYSNAYEMAYEDVEYCFRTWLEGGKVFYDSQIACNHCESASRGTYVGEREVRSFEQWTLGDFSTEKLERVLHLVSSANDQGQ